MQLKAHFLQFKFTTFFSYPVFNFAIHAFIIVLHWTNWNSTIFFPTWCYLNFASFLKNGFCFNSTFFDVKPRFRSFHVVSKLCPKIPNTCKKLYKITISSYLSCLRKLGKVIKLLHKVKLSPSKGLSSTSKPLLAVVRYAGVLFLCLRLITIFGTIENVFCK